MMPLKLVSPVVTLIVSASLCSSMLPVMLPFNRLITVAPTGAVDTSIASPRCIVVPPSVENRAMMSPELLMVRTWPAAGVAVPLLVTRMP